MVLPVRGITTVQVTTVLGLVLTRYKVKIQFLYHVFSKFQNYAFKSIYVVFM